MNVGKQRAVRIYSSGLAIYSLMLVMVTLSVMGLTSYFQSYADTDQRQKEDDLLQRGRAIREAIVLYHQNTPGSIKQYPRRLSDLELDLRFVGTFRYIRRVGLDPMTGQSWRELRNLNGDLVGVASSSSRKPFKEAGFLPHESFFGGRAYREWYFVVPNEKVSEQ